MEQVYNNKFYRKYEEIPENDLSITKNNELVRLDIAKIIIDSNKNRKHNILNGLYSKSAYKPIDILIGNGMLKYEENDDIYGECVSIGFYDFDFDYINFLLENNVDINKDIIDKLIWRFSHHKHKNTQCGKSVEKILELLVKYNYTTQDYIDEINKIHVDKNDISKMFEL